eukprot:maker-scaffold907_size82601-snap-gene-0.24 protein:Tk01575 transcript:maker-scaffold907_size82601-snap-gene-0.24-mRNA-1 annotation:"c-type lectin precursor"
MMPEVLLVVLLALGLSSAQIFRLPDKSACESTSVQLARLPTHAGKTHFTRDGKNYHLSWLELGKSLEFTWEGARNYCRKFCMDSITIDSQAENEMVKTILRRGNELQVLGTRRLRLSGVQRQSIPYIWTGGHKCNFRGCERQDLQPAIVNGWYWAPTGIRIRPPGQCSACDWSPTGGYAFLPIESFQCYFCHPDCSLKESQPDNRESSASSNPQDEACIAILNNFYQDGIRWHDVGCRHTKPVICQDVQILLDYVNVD